jgi:hypothetical protein
MATKKGRVIVASAMACSPVRHSEGGPSATYTHQQMGDTVLDHPRCLDLAVDLLSYTERFGVRGSLRDKAIGRRETCLNVSDG